MRKVYDALSLRAQGLSWNRGWKQIERTRGGRYLKTYCAFQIQQCYCTYEITATITLNKQTNKKTWVYSNHTKVLPWRREGKQEISLPAEDLLREKKSVFFKDVKMGRLKNSRTDSYIQDELGSTNWTWWVYRFKKWNHIVLWGEV